MDHRPRRQALIASILRRQHVESQDQLQAILAEQGITVAQATLSRDLRALGVVKGPSGYFLPDQPGPLPAYEPGALARTLGMFVRSVDVGGNLVVLRTGPGHAQIVALELDRSPPENILGTIAGDDTIFIAARSENRAQQLAESLRRNAGLDSALHGVGA
ncbi:MAG: arginine repressor [Phycisphaeraceae bacterium]|nr:arginine repressor [Phycisphaeraceae bacterium]MCW5754415.1 arginine repressor [Phycisphaeraceae bacterium]